MTLLWPATIAPAPGALRWIVLCEMTHPRARFWFTAPWPSGGMKPSMVRWEIVTLLASLTNANWLRPWPEITAPGAPMNVSPSFRLDLGEPASAERVHTGREPVGAVRPEARVREVGELFPARTRTAPV